MSVNLHQAHSCRSVISCCYRPPSSPVRQFSADFTELTENLYLHSNDVTILGDINVDLSSSNVPQDVVDVFVLYQLKNIVESPTRVTATSSCLIDVILVSHPHLYSPAQSLDSCGISDHHLVISCRQSTRRVREPSVQLVRSMKDFNLEKFLSDLEHVPWSVIESIDNIDDKWSMWKDLFLDVVNVHAPLKKRRYRLKPSLPWINSSILHRIRQRDKFRRESLNRLRLLDERLYYQHLYRQARSQVRKELAAAKSAFFQHTLASVKSNPREFWRLINKITRRKPVRAYSEPSSADIADVFRSIVGKREPSCLPFAGRLGCSSNHRQFSFRHISPLEVELRLLHLNPRKADGCDGVQARFLMLGAPAVATSLAHIFNFSLAQGTFANEWKLAVVTPVFKKEMHLTLLIIVQFLFFLQFQKFLRALFSTNYMII